MKKIIIGLLMMTGVCLKAQTLSNPGFENWGIISAYSSDTVPNQWWSMFCNTTHQSTDSYQGTYATRLQGYMSCGIAQGIMVNGQQPANYYNLIESGTPFTTKPATVGGFYKYTGATGNDSAEVTVILKKYNTFSLQRDTVGIGRASLAPTTGYVSFNVNINYLMPSATPDSIIIIFNSSKYNQIDLVNWTLPSLYIDRLLFPQSVAGITENQQNVIEAGIYPNPFTEHSTLQINGDLSSYKDLELTIFDAAGKRIKAEKITGSSIELSGFSAGNYLYSISNGNTVLLRGKAIVK